MTDHGRAGYVKDVAVQYNGVLVEKSRSLPSCANSYFYVWFSFYVPIKSFIRP